ncbi:MAG: amidohydrolase family protein, partial [Candidatus Erginobacter occultus]|nr:amidohydrolase family protein [Candidatus Erginobacter occultus]
MTCLRKPHARLLARMQNIYPDLAKLEKELLNIDDIEPDTQSLLEPPLEYEKSPPAELVIKNARLPGKEGGDWNIAVKEKYIVEVGDSERVEPFIDEKTLIIDAEGSSVLPGFCDSHLHLLKGAEHLSGCDMEGVEKADEFKKRLGDFAKDHPDEPVVYVYGVHYFDPPLIPAETTRHFLDTIIKDKPLLVFAHDLHTAWANTKALEISNLLRKMPPYPTLIETLDLDGNIVLGEDKIPGGELREPEVYYLVEGKLRAKFPQPPEKQLENLLHACRELTRLGFTSVHRMGLSHPVEDIAFLLLILELEHRGKLPLRVFSSISSVADQNMLEDVRQAHQIRRALDKARSGKLSVEQLYEFLFEQLKQAGGSRHQAVSALVEKYRDSSDYPHLEKIEQLSRTIRDLNWKRYIEPHQKRGNIYQRDELGRYLNPDAKIRCDTVKIFMDGVIEKDTAYRLDRDPVEGIPAFTQSQLNLVVDLADRLGMQVAAHSIGNAAVRSMLDAI